MTNRVDKRVRPNLRRVLSTLLIASALPIAAQQGDVNLNSYYRFPASFGVQYQPLTGIGNRRLSDFQINEIAGEVRLSLARRPAMQPFVQGGVVDYTFLDAAAANQDWTHRHAYAAGGFGLATRLSKEFEIGFDIVAGATQSFFGDLDLPGDGGSDTKGQINVLGGASAKLALNPSYNVSIAVKPSVRYLYGLGPLDEFDGLTYGVGFMVSYRLGQDPDAATSSIRAIRFSGVEFPPLFAAMQSYYADNPTTTITIENTEKTAIENVQVAFMQAGFMDSPTPAAEIAVLEPGESIEVPIYATFNDEVFTTQGITPLTGEIIAEYTTRGRPVEQHQSVSYELHDRNALTWDDDRKVAAFITAQDSAVRNYASFVRQIHRDDTNQYLSENLQFAMQAYNALAELGILYQVDPSSPFTQVQENALVVDSISLPRETLARLTGDCDDLTVLYDTMLQSVGIETAFVTIPGHIYCAFNTGVQSRDHAMVHPDRDMLVEIDGNIWVLVEITLMGRAGFLEAWSTGVSQFKKYDDNPDVRGFFQTAHAQQVFRPVGLRETDLGLQYGDEEAIVARFREDMERLSTSILAPQRQEAEGRNSSRMWNRYGIAAAQVGAYREAQDAFARSLQIERDSLGAQLNLGSLHYLLEEYDRALGVFSDAERTISGGRSRTTHQLKVFLNLSKTHYALGNYDRARAYYENAQSVNPDEVARFSYLGSGGSITGRASEAAGAEPILFFEE